MVLAALLFCGPARANPFDWLGAGSGTAAQAGAGAASSTGPAATFLNPAALTLEPDCAFDLGYSVMVPRFRAEPTDLGSLGNLRPYQRFDASRAFDEPATREALREAFRDAAGVGRLDGFFVMGSFPFRRAIRGLGREVTLGALVFLPGAGTEVVRVEGATPNDPVMPWLGSRLHRLMAVVSAGVELWPKRIAIGAGMMVLADIAGFVESVAPISVFNPKDPDHPPPPATSVATFRQRLATDVSPVVGLLVRPLDSLSLGVVYRGPMDLSLDFDVKAGVYFDLGGVPIQADIPYRLRAHFFYLPAELTFAVSGRPWTFLAVNADLTVGFTSSLGSHLPVTEFTLDPSAVGPNGELTALASLGHFRASTEPPLRVWTRNIVSPRVGVEVRPIRSLAVLAGYAYHPSPFAADQRYANMIMDSGYHRIAFGVAADLADPTGTFRRPLHLGAHFSAILLNQRYNRVGRADEAGDRIAAGVVRTSGYALGGGVTAGFRF